MSYFNDCCALSGEKASDTTAPRVLFASSEQNADILYASKFLAPDPFIYILHLGKKYLIVSDLEIDRARREARVDCVISSSKLALELEKEQALYSSSSEEARILILFLKKHGISRVEVPATFPLFIADSLRRAYISVQCVPDPFWPQREKKSPAEIRYLQRSLSIAQAGMKRAFEVLRGARIGRHKILYWGRTPLTSERLRAEIEICVVRRGGTVPHGSIVAGGGQAVNPHETGGGPLFANQLTIIDIFPRHAISGYFGDLTRTVVKGHASDAQRHLWKVCLQGQKQILSQIRPGALGLNIHRGVRDFFAKNGYPTKMQGGRWSGFFHSAGHGLGLEVHEYPRFASVQFLPSQVFTVEPGIYIPGLGGVRHEDVIQVTNQGSKLLTRLHKPLEL
ncbi:Xaa-Pro dipeptidase [Candidatus Xiphinematobacter sp. Idaho Grape]|uniref:M24 family metallopeptidase n=1 Tax=Candidatus Xiphinematobacter sp. Idaho Grape TaxID=1704307 RepID=UPI0007060BC1|nr:Xaa-Pro peptidase family protein [Candidatus Xiphinematobacter sp. Idaho Grape]ALJ56472.1 Xaa-Pro dipeptidase [Candidatus Xiphinematobacter sp. Idaho Grape]